MIISVASLGVLPTDLISEFTNCKTIEDFFATLKGKFDTVQDSIGQLVEQARLLSPHIAEVKKTVNIVRTAASLLNAVDRIVKQLQPYIDKINALLRRAFTWWNRWLFDAIMWPMEKIINLIVTPFRGIINDIIRRINPFGFIDKLLSQISSPLNLLLDPNTLISHLDILEVIGDSTSFEPVKDYFTQGVVI